MSSAIRCRDLKKTYPGKPPVDAVRGVDLEVAQRDDDPVEARASSVGGPVVRVH